MKTIARPSPNHDERPGPVDMLVMHYTGMKTAEEALARLCDPAARVSAHYTVDLDGTVYAHVPEERRAWHAGISYWTGERNINACSVGIEIVNPGHEFGYVEFPEVQIAAVIDLGNEIMRRHKIAPARVVGHSDVAPARKEDPGELFPWPDLAEFGVGLWPFPAAGKTAERSGSFPPPFKEVARAPTPEGGVSAVDDEAAEIFLQRLRDFGYGVPPDVDVSLDKLVRAFQRHWRPWRIDGVIDDESAYRLGTLVDALS